MFLLPIVTWLRLGFEHTSPIGIGSPITVSEPSLTAGKLHRRFR